MIITSHGCFQKILNSHDEPKDGLYLQILYFCEKIDIFFAKRKALFYNFCLLSGFRIFNEVSKHVNNIIRAQLSPERECTTSAECNEDSKGRIQRKIF